SSRRRHTRFSRDWSSDVCSSDLAGNFTNLNVNGAVGTAVGGYQAGSINQTTTLNGSTNHQVFTGVAGNLTNFANLVINNTFAGRSEERRVGKESESWRAVENSNQ